MSDKLYNIEPKEFKVLERHEVGNSITYVLEPITKPTECPNCHDTNFMICWNKIKSFAPQMVNTELNS